MHEHKDEPTPSGNDSADYKSAYLRNGIYAVVKAWYEAGCQESAEAMDRLLKRVIHRREY